MQGRAQKSRVGRNSYPAISRLSRPFITITIGALTDRSDTIAEFGSIDQSSDAFNTAGEMNKEMIAGSYQISATLKMNPGRTASPLMVVGFSRHSTA